LFPIESLTPLLDEGFQLLTPNIRLARIIRTAWNHRQLEKGIKVWTPIPVMPLESWLSRAWENAVSQQLVPATITLDVLRSRELWLQVIAADRNANGDYSLLQPGAAAELAATARENLLLWRIDMSAGSQRGEFQLDDDCGAFLRWLDAYNAHMAKDGLATRLDNVAELSASSYQETASRIALIDFDDLPPLYRVVVESVAAEHQWVQTTQTPGTAGALAFADPAAELAGVAQWAARRYNEKPEATTGIILARMDTDRAPLEYLLRQEFGCLGENYTSLPVNFSTGISLDLAPVVRDALRILGSSERDVPLSDVLGLLQSRFVSHAEAASEGATQLIQNLFRAGQDPVDTGQLRYAALEVDDGDHKGLALGECLKQLFEMRLYRGSRTPSQWVEAFNQVLGLWGWPGPGPLDSLEYQQVQTWYETLEKFAAFDRICTEIKQGDALRILKQCCQSQVSQPKTEGNQVQVLGLLEGAGLVFDALWIVGLQGSQWPAPTRLNPFIPAAIQRRHDMPHASNEREWKFASSLLQRYRQASGQFIASYARQIDGVADLPSPLLHDLEWDERSGTAELPRAWLERWQLRELEHLADDKGGEVDASELKQVRGGSAILADQANCPFRTFARRRLGAEPLDELRRGLSAADRGTILHNALYTLWGDLKDSQRLCELEQTSLQELIARAAQSAIEAVPAMLRQIVGVHCLKLEQQRLQTLLAQWLELEKQREPFKVVAREESLEIDLAGLPLRLRVDRVDEVATGQRLVIDYKSGKNSLGEWLGQRPTQPQLPLYGTAVPAVAGVAFAEIRARECRLQGIGTLEGVPGLKNDVSKAVKRYSPAQDWAALKAEWQMNLEQLARDFLAGDSEIDPLPGACQYCGLDSLCRVGMGEEVTR
jgi:probable DNA repair protein